MRLISFLFAGFLTCMISSYGQTVPGTISYQGILMQSDGITPLADGSHTIIFKFYTVASGGTAMVGFDKSVSISTTKGLFTCIIGGGTAPNAPFSTGEMAQLGSQQIYIGIAVDGGTELSPRAQLTPATYALQAQSAYTISDNAVTTGKIADGAVTDVKLASGIDAGKITTGTIDAARLPATTLIGSGSSGNIPFWTGSTTFGNDAGLFWDNTVNKRLGLGTTTPATRIHVVGTNVVSGDDDIAVESIGATNPSVQLRRARGTPDARTSIVTNDLLGRISFQGYTGVTSSVGSEIRSVAESDFNSTVNAGIIFRTTMNGTQADRMKISSVGDIDIQGEVHNTSISSTSNIIPIAYGTVNSNATIFNSGSGNWSVSYFTCTTIGTTAYYEIDIGETVTGSTHVILVTPEGLGFARSFAGVIVCPGGDASNLRIYTYDTAPSFAQMKFSFIIYKP